MGLPQAGEDEHVGLAHLRCDVRALQATGEPDIRCNAEIVRLLLQMIAQRSIPDDVECDRVTSVQERLHCVKQISMAFDFDKVSHAQQARDGRLTLFQGPEGPRIHWA